MKFVITEEERYEIKKLYGALLNEQSGGNPISFFKIVDVPNIPKNQLFDLIVEWLTTAYKNVSSVIQLQNKEQGLIVLKGNHSWNTPKGFGGRIWDGRIHHTIKIQVKDNKFKIDMFDLRHDSDSTPGEDPINKDFVDLGLLTDRPIFGDKPRYSLYQNKAWPLVKDAAKNNFENFVSSLTSGIQTFKKDDDFQP